MIKKSIYKLYKILQIKWLAWVLVLMCMIAIYLLSNMDYVRSWHLTGKTLEVVQQSSEETIEMSYDEEVSHYSSEENEGDMLVLRKLAHVLEYLGLGLLSYNAFSAIRMKRKVLLALLLGVSYALFDEMHQLLVPGRDGSLVDVGIDSVGVILGVLLMFLIMHHMNKIEKVG